MVGAILNTSFDMLTLGFLFWATGYRVSVAVLLAGYGIPQILGKFTLILGGVGVIETSMVGLYTLLGAPKPIAVVAVLAYRLLSFWIPTLIGVALVPYLERWTGTSGGPTAAVESGHQLRV
jgi:glycosyltransferase 2 family protein